MPSASPTPKLDLPRQKRLRQRGEFARIREKGSRLAAGCLIGNWRSVDNASFSRLGVVTSKKVGPSVARSRARRLLREAFRAHQHKLNPVEIVLIARPSIAGRSFSEVERDFLRLLTQARLLKHS